MRATRPALALLAGAATVAAIGGPTGPAAAGPAPTTVTAQGAGPLKLGMTRTAAVKTGWLSGRGTGCPLGGPPLPITYVLHGPKAPKALRGTAQFDGGKLTVLTFGKGVRTDQGVTVGTTSSRMVSRYRAAGFTAKAERSELFGGTFVTVTEGGKDVIAGFAEKGRITQLGLPAIPVCE
ncbi:hypothetical protein AB0L40_07745 [Patulibacter sp. NPDC049589]|uniref:hypothetical protein n=1 Tax=Patulibacter sp. NPDC049589 TaxID=3154731 RepID=UPI003424683F